MRAGAAARAAALSAAIAFTLALIAAPAGAVVVEAAGHGFGVTPSRGFNAATLSGAQRARSALRASAPRRVRGFDELPFGGEDLEWFGGPVMHSNTTHLIYWDPNKEFSTTTKNIIDGFFGHVQADSAKATNVFAIAGQYKDAEANAAYKSTFAGALVDEAAYPTTGNCTVPKEVDLGPPYTTCVFDKQLRSQLSTFITKNELPKGPAQLYFLLLPHKVVTCLEEVVEGKQVCSNNFVCAYHSYISPGTAGEVIYADIPFSLLDTNHAKDCQDDGHPSNIQQPNPDNGSKGEDSETRFADVALKYISHEFIEATTDPLVGAKTAWADLNGLEIGDKCNGVTPDPAEDGIGYDKNAFLPVVGGKAEEGNLFDQSINGGQFYLQSEWDNAHEACLMRPAPLTGADFVNGPKVPLEGQSVQFTGGVTDPYGQPEFQWKFGDGAEAGGEFPQHTYAEAGEYHVVMEVKDGLTDALAAAVEKTVVVEEPPTASFTAEGKTVKEAIKLDGKASKDPDGKIENYVWEFGDGAKAEGTSEAAEHKYAKPGVYTVTLTVEDSSKLTAKAAKEIRVIDAPAVTTEEPSAIGQTSATLNARVNPNGAIEECRLEFREASAGEWTQLPCTPAPGAVFSEVAVSATLTALKTSTSYRFRITAKNTVATSVAAERVLVTLPKLPPGAGTETASSLTSAGATLGALVDPRGAVVEECRFEYGTSVFYEASAPCATLPGGGSGPVAVSAAIGGLAASTTYHFRVVAISNAGRGEGPDVTFTTSAPPASTPVSPKPSPNSTFTAKAAANARTGAITAVVSVRNPGSLSWLATFANGKFGVFSSSASKCKKRYVKLAGKCRPATILYATGRASAPGAATVTVTLKPTASARKALATARKRNKPLVVTLKLTFQSSFGGTPVSSTIALTIRPGKK